MTRWKKCFLQCLYFHTHAHDVTFLQSCDTDGVPSSFGSDSLKLAAGFHTTFPNNFISSSGPDLKHTREGAQHRWEYVRKPLVFVCVRQRCVAAGEPGLE